MRDLPDVPRAPRSPRAARAPFPTLVALLAGCSGPPAPAEPSSPAAPERPAVPTPAASGAFFVASPPTDEPAQVREPGPARLVPQRRPGAPQAIAFVGERSLAVLDERGTITLVDPSDGVVRAVFPGLGAPPLEVHGDVITARSMVVDLREGRAWWPRLAAPETWEGWSHASPRGDRFVEQGGGMVLGGARDGARIATIDQHAGREPGVHWLPDGERFALCDRAVEVHAASDGSLVARWEADATLDDRATCSVRPHGGAIAWIGARTVTVLRPDTLAVLGSLPPEGEARPDRVGWSSDGGHLVTWRRGSGRVAVYDAVRGELVRALDAGAEAGAVAVGAGGRWLAVGDQGRVVIVDVASGERRELPLETGERSPGPAHVAFDGTGTRVAVACGRTLGVLDLLSGPDATLTRLGTRELPDDVSLVAEAAGDGPSLYVGASPAFQWGEAGATRVSVTWGELSSVGADGRARIDRSRYRRHESRATCHVATRLADAALVVLAADGSERSTLALDDGERSPCAEGPACGLPIAIDEACAWVAVQRGERLRLFDASTGRASAERSVGDRIFAADLAIVGDTVRTLREDDSELALWRAPALRPLFRERLPESEQAPMFAFGPGAAWHAHAVNDALVIASLPARGRPVRVAVRGETTALSAVGDALVRETQHALELRDPRSGALLDTLESHGPRLALEAGVEPPTMSFVDCSGGHLRAVTSGSAPRVLGTCTTVESFVRVGALVAFVDDGRVRLLRPADGALATLEPFVRGDDAWLSLVDASEAAVAGPAERADAWRLRAAGPVLDATLDPASFDPSLLARFAGRP
jgi:hypothetical protein